MSDNMQAKTVFFRAFGCKQNQYETDFLREVFAANGFEVVDAEPADIVVINTCAVTQRGAAKCRQAIRRAARHGARVVVTGCYGQIAPGEVAQIPGVILVTGVHGRDQIVSLVKDALSPGGTERDCPLVQVKPHAEGQPFEETPVQRPVLTRAFLKVQEGCDDFCTYCVVPYARGPSRSRPVSAILEEAGGLVERGYKEIVLTGTHLGLYGKGEEQGEFPALSEVIRRLCNVPGLQRLRISSLEPHDVTEDLIECLKLPQVCHHLHLPVQSGSDRILKTMGRRYDVSLFLETVRAAREVAPDVGITTDIIAGFPGETEEDFSKTLAVAREAEFSRIHAFKFSARPMTRAYHFPGKVSEKEKERRVSELIGLGKELSVEFHRKHIGRIVEVLVEDERAGNGLLTGLTGNYVRCFLPGPDVYRGQIVLGKAVRESSNGVYLEDTRLR